MFSRRMVLFGVLFVLLAAFQPVWSQESRGTVLGRITDSSGAVVPNASVELTNLATRVVGRASTNEDGNYFFAYLTPGMYQIRADKAGSTLASS
jgi:protocatechuate 3,4-dioxygenase beta subunit